MGLSLGAYLSHPITDKYSSDEENSKMTYGVSSMQGWRETQEDAHNCILNYDADTSLFAVYDGHGGNEVSEYTSQHLPNFLKKNNYYKMGDYENALKDSFVKFDCSLKEPEVIKILQKLAKYNECNDDENSESEDENLGSLKAEALMSIEEVMAKYAKNHKEKKLNNSEAVKLSDKAKVSEKCSEISSNGMECSSSKPSISFNESDSEVSSSSSCAVSRKCLSEKYNSNEKLSDPLLDSTSKGSEELNCNVTSEVNRLNGLISSESNLAESKTELETKKCFSEKTEAEATDDKKNNCNGKTAERKSKNKNEETIISSVNGDTVKGKCKGKGKALLKLQQKPKKNNSEKLFHKFINSDSNEEISESDSDDATFNGPESGSDDDDDDDDDDEGEDEDDENDKSDSNNSEDDEEESVVEREKLKEKEEEGEDENDEDDDDEDDEGSEDYEYENENDMDRCFMEPGSESGCTALVALIKGKKLYVANAGDCRCVVSKNGEAVEMSFDHKPENEIELKRIEKAGGRVSAGRVNDGLNLSRALGDHVYKRTPDLPPEEQMISPLPDIQVLNLEPDIEFMVLACDGIWNSMSSKEVIDFVRPKLLERNDNLSKICEELFDHCLAPNTLCDGTGCDNMTAIIVEFKDSELATHSRTSKKRFLDESREAEECTKKQKTENVSSTNSNESKESPNVEVFPKKWSDSPDTTQ